MDLKPIYDAVVSGDERAVTVGVQVALDAQVPAEQVLGEALIPAMGQVGSLFEAGEYYVPEMMLSALAMQAGLALLRPLLAQTGVGPAATVVLGTVKGDLHDIGKNLVGMMMEGAGFRVIDLGINVAPERFVDAVRKGAQVLGLSALLTTTMPNMKAVIKALTAAGVREQVKVLVGGAPLTQAFANQIGADAYAPDASAAARKAGELLQC